MISGDALGAMLPQQHRGNFVTLARMIAGRKIVAFNWQGQSWIPMFQFDSIDLTFKPGLCRILDELAGAPSGWTIAAWFVEPNGLLSGQRPLDLMQTDWQAVLAAAQCRQPE
jgi:hypothetical protein